VEGQQNTVFTKYIVFVFDTSHCTSSSKCARGDVGDKDTGSNIHIPPNRRSLYHY